MKKNKAIGVVVAIALFLGLLTYTTAVGFGPTGTGAAKNITLGLDLSGGVSITYEVVGDENPSAEDMKDTIYKLQQRVDGYSTEAQVYQEGTNRINIEIPGVSDANTILEELGKPGSLQFQLEDGTVVVDGSQAESAEAGDQQDNLKNNENVVKLEFNSEGAAAFANATSENIGKSIYIVYDGDVISAPTVQSAITDGSAVITGMADAQEAENLASSIRIGSLSLELQELRSNVVGAKLGQEAISTRLKAGAIGFGIVVVFMIFAYLIPGLAASIALCLYVGLILVLLAAFEVTLTLPGVAGIILSIGMPALSAAAIAARALYTLCSPGMPRLILPTFSPYLIMSKLANSCSSTMLSALKSLPSLRPKVMNFLSLTPAMARSVFASSPLYMTSLRVIEANFVNEAMRLSSVLK